ncbi:MAG: alpha/beta hydrolase [Candidatus Zixiibacteriota bacterium]
MLTAVLAIVAVYLAICVAAFLIQRKLIYHPNRQVGGTPATVGLEYQELTLTADDSAEFKVWRIHRVSPRAVVVCFHGNADNISWNLELYRTWYNLGAEIVAFEYRGYLDTKGEPSEAGIDRDLTVLADSLKNWYPDELTKVIAMGRSLGGAVAAKLAKIYPIDGIILESTFSTMADVAQERFPFLPARLLLRERYDSESIVNKLSIPILVIHSTADEVIPFHLGRKLYNAANEPKEFVEIQGGHNSGIEISQAALERTYSDFLNRILLQEHTSN